MGRGRDGFKGLMGTRRGTRQAPLFDPQRDARPGTDQDKLREALAYLRSQGLAAKMARSPTDRAFYLPPRRSGEGWVVTEPFASRMMRHRPGTLNTSLAVFFASDKPRGAGDDDGHHAGQIAQRVVQALCRSGLDASWDGDICHAVMVRPRGIPEQPHPRTNPYYRARLERREAAAAAA
jgi:hypothetical protein